VVLEEDKTVAGVQEAKVVELESRPFFQEGEGRVDVWRHGPRCQIDETETDIDKVLWHHEEESLHCLGELLPVVRVRNEVAPGLGDALEPADGLCRDAGEDLHQGVVGEGGHCHRALVLGAVHATESDLRSGGRDGNVSECERERERESSGNREEKGALPAAGDGQDRRRRRGAVRGKPKSSELGKVLNPRRTTLVLCGGRGNL